MNNINSFISIRNIKKDFGSHVVLDNINIEIQKGEIFSLLGASGCGKTTLLRIIAGFERPDNGSVIIDGQDVTNILPNKRPVNMMFQNYALFPHMSVYKNVAFGLMQEKLSSKEINSRACEALDIVGMLDLSRRMPNQLSGGQQQRVALARSIVKRPKLLLLDEPLGALDDNTREKTQMELIKIQNYLDLNFIIVTHDQDEAMSLSDRIGVMHNGSIMQIGSGEEIYERPTSIYVANFIGAINILDCEVANYCGQYVEVFIKNSDVRFTEIAKKIYKNGQDIWFAIRPEELTISSIPHKENHIIGDIMDIAFMGSEIFYSVQMSDGKIIRISLPSVARNKESDLCIGGKAYVSWDAKDGVLLDV